MTGSAEGFAVVAGNTTVVLTPQDDWAPVQYRHGVASGYRQYSGLWLPKRLDLELRLSPMNQTGAIS